MNTIKSISHSHDELHIEWSDGRASHLAAIWLRDHCQMPQSRDPVSGQRLLNVTDIDPNISIAAASLVQDSLVQHNLAQQTLTVSFSPDQHTSVFTAQWLSEHCYCLNHQTDSRSSAFKQLWNGASFAKGLPVSPYPAFCADAKEKLTALNFVKDVGFCILTEVPCDDQQVLQVIKQFGFVRDTNYGALFEVRSKINANNLAYTHLELGCHLDNPYRDPVPGLQLLHCLASTTEGGESILQDGFMAAHILRDENRQHFDLLSKQFINFRFQDKEVDLNARAPMIEFNDHGEVIKVRFNNRSIDTIKLSPEKIRPFYTAYRHFAQILERQALQIHFKLAAGELMLFDNTRILHGRKAYSKGGIRHLQGAYSDLDGLYSTLSVLQRHASTPASASVAP
ncbi:MAG: TauD/TfdA family dioxygenase [Arenicellales bacterium WSBS_2016_MAG_OTU3]